MDAKDTFLRPSATIKGSLLVKTAPSKANVVGVYSSKKLSETDAEIRLDASHCKYIRKQRLTEGNFPIDLKEYKEIRKDYESKAKRQQQNMTIFLKYLEKLVSGETFVKFSANKLFNADIICNKGVLTKMMMVHGDNQENFSLLCTKYKGNIYITRRKKANQKDYVKFMERHALLADKPNTDIHTNDPQAKFHCVFNWTFCGSNVMYFSKVQGVENDSEIVPETDLSNIQIATFKTNFDSTAETRFRFVNRSAFRWCEAFLLNAKIYILNVNDKDEILEGVKTFGVDDFLRENEKHWKKSSNERLSFLNLMIDLIKLRMTFVNCPLSVYEFEFYPKTQSTVHYKIHSGRNGRNELTFLTDQYIAAIKDL